MGRDVYEMTKEGVKLSGAERVRKWRKAHPEKEREARQRVIKKNQLLKQDVLTHYGGGKCACIRCDFNDIRALSIDHIGGGGNRVRARRFKGTGTFYRWLQQENYPEGYQTLCMNCQFIKSYEKGERGLGRPKKY